MIESISSKFTLLSLLEISSICPDASINFLSKKLTNILFILNLLSKKEAFVFSTTVKGVIFF